MSKFGRFFKDLGLTTFSFYDYIERKPEKKQELIDAFDVDFEHPHTGFEALVVNEVGLDRQWRFMNDLRESGDSGGFQIPEERPADDELKQLVKSALKGSKGTGWAARLLEDCSVDELPKSVVDFLSKVYEFFPKTRDGMDYEPDEDDEVNFL